MSQKLWIVYLSGIIGIIGIRYAAEVFAKLIERLPSIERSAHLLILWIGIYLLIDSGLLFFELHRGDYLWLDGVFWSGLFFFFVLGLTTRGKEIE